MEMLKKKLSAHRNGIGIVMCMIVTILGIGYYYAIHMAFVPNGEDLNMAWLWSIHETFGKRFDTGNVLWNVILKSIFQTVGIRYGAIRLEFTSFYALILIFTLILSMNGSRREKRYEMLPLFAVFMVFLHTVSAQSEFGVLWTETDMIYMYPYDYHGMSQIFALGSIVFLFAYFRSQKKWVKIISGIVFLLWSGYGVKHTDLIYLVVFVTPFFIAMIIHALYQEKAGKIVWMLVPVALVCIFCSKIVPVPFLQNLWGMEQTGVYGSVYGASNFIGMDKLGNNFMNYLDVVCQIFNVDLQNRPVLSMWTIVYMAKLVCLVFGYYVMFRIIKSSLIGKLEQNGFDIIDELVAWGYLILSFVFIFTQIGLYTSNMRYVTIWVPLMTIMLCRHAGRHLLSIIPSAAEYKTQIKKVLVTASAGLCLCYIEPVWTYEAPDSFWDDCTRVIEYVEETDLGYAVAPHWIYARLTTMTGGETIFYPSEKSVKGYNGEDAKMTYLISSVGYDSIPTMFNNVADVENYEELCDKYGTPTEVIPLQNFSIYVFE